MILQIKNILTCEQVKEFRDLLDNAEWIDGKKTTGHQSAYVKDNLQLEEGSELARYLGAKVEDALGNNPLFVSAALPLKLYPPMFNKYENGGTFGFHVDNAIRQLRGTDYRVRTDVSTTIFLSDPEEYDGGELVIEDTYGTHRVRLPAGDMVLYPSTSLHEVTPVTRGARIASFFWTQSLVKDVTQRRTLFQLDSSIQSLATTLGSDNAQVVDLTYIYHNLMRQWVDV